MSVQARHRWIGHRLGEAFAINDDELLERNLRQQGNLKVLDEFLAGLGPRAIFAFHETGSTFSTENGEGEVDILISANPSERVNRSTCSTVYFLRSKSGTALDHLNVEDGAISYGLIHDPIQSLQTYAYALYQPTLQQQSDWGKCNTTHKETFFGAYSGFEQTLGDCIKTLNAGLKLTRPDERYTNPQQNFAQFAKSPHVIAHYHNLLKTWCTQTENFLNETSFGGGHSEHHHHHHTHHQHRGIHGGVSGGDGLQWDDPHAGPDTEIEYWKRRLQRLSSIIEQIKTKSCKDVIFFLNALVKAGQPPPGGEDRDQAIADSEPEIKVALSQQERDHFAGLLRRWNQVDLGITEAANEAKDNVKYLKSLEKFVLPLKTGTITAVIDLVAPLMNSIKMIHTIARYYSTPQRMGGLLRKTTNAMIQNCMMNIERVAKATLHGAGAGGGGTGSTRRATAAAAAAAGDGGGGGGDKLQQHHQQQQVDSGNSTSGGGDFWDSDLEAVSAMMENALRLNEVYLHEYHTIKERLQQQPTGRQFDFSEDHIFGNFDNFCRRLMRMIDIASTIQQFRALADYKLEGMSEIVHAFFKLKADFQARKFDALDFTNTYFDQTYQVFNQNVVKLEQKILVYINSSFENITSIKGSLVLLKKLQRVLQRETLSRSLDNKFLLIFHNYGLDLNAVQDIYEKYKHNPPMPRNTPPVTGNILWCRHLLKRIEQPMKEFERNPNILATKEAKRIVKTFNNVARTLVSFEYLWYDAWCRAIDAARAGLSATLIVQHPETGKLYVNFDPDIFRLLREAKCLSRMNIDIPETAKNILLQEAKFKRYYDDLKFMLDEYNRVVACILPITADLLRPFKRDLELALKPGLISLTWTSMNIDAFKRTVYSKLEVFEALINNVVDIIDNRVYKNLREISRSVFCDLESTLQRKSFTLEEFIRLQEARVRREAAALQSKNHDIEQAVEDVFTRLRAYPLSEEAGTVSEAAIADLRAYYNRMTFNALLQATKQSLYALKERVCTRVQVGGAAGFLFVQRPFFEVGVQLAIPTVALTPSLKELQKCINKVALIIVRCTSSVFEWNQLHIPAAKRRSFFQRIGSDLEVVRVCLLLTGGVRGTQQVVEDYLGIFRKYDWVWKDDMEMVYRNFIMSDPGIEEVEAKLREFESIEAEIAALSPIQVIGALSLNTHNLKSQLRSQCREWKIQYSKMVHEQAKQNMEGLLEYIRSTRAKLAVEVMSLDSLRVVMSTLKEIRSREATIELEISPILDMYQLLENHLPLGYMDKAEIEQKGTLRSAWRELSDEAEVITDKLSDVQGRFREKLLQDVAELQADAIKFREDYLRNGPMQMSLSPAEAMEALKHYKAEFKVRERKMEVYAAGEKLFALNQTQYHELTTTREELVLLDKLYRLYMEVLDTTKVYRGMIWPEVQSRLNEMNDTATFFDARCAKLPQSLHTWTAYTKLRERITQFLAELPLLRDLTSPSIKARHWDQISAITRVGSKRLVYNVKKPFTLSQLLDTQILKHEAAIREVVVAADKQMEIERKFNEIRSKWNGQEFVFATWKNRKAPVLAGVASVIDELEDSTMTLQTMLTMRHVEPFQDEVTSQLHALENTTDTLENWVKVQLLWTSLESVFTGGDIAKQMPTEAKKFVKVDKEWLKLMTKAYNTANVLECCSNEALQNTLPLLYVELEKCQKSLEGYLMQKRNIFPRFYFVSNPVLLQILSQGSDTSAVQQFYEKLFDSINRVRHSEDNSRLITHIQNLGTGGNHGINSNSGGGASANGTESQQQLLNQEIIELLTPVMASGNIEVWLKDLEKRMKETVKGMCEAAVVEVLAPREQARSMDAANAAADLALDNNSAATAPVSKSSHSHANIALMQKFRATLDSTCTQLAVLALQLGWTFDCEEALVASATNKTAMSANMQRQTDILHELSKWCLGASENHSPMERIKLETLVAVQVHQRDVFQDLGKRYKAHSLSSTPASDFEWLKRARFYWQPDVADELSMGALVIEICDVSFQYAHEYLGCKTRLIVTPLQERAYITLSQALSMYLGGAPLGPAGTGKTETVKDLAHSLGLAVIVTNCTDQQRYEDIAKIFKGLCQSGLWGCFDEFNRIQLPVLSVVAQQVLAIQNAKRAGQTSFQFPGSGGSQGATTSSGNRSDNANANLAAAGLLAGGAYIDDRIALRRNVGYFITMNPAYSGRHELPENLKDLFRSVSMMVPDRETIVRVKLCTYGYVKFNELARKFDMLYRLCEQQLSQQKQYDFGLRSMLPVLKLAGARKRDAAARRSTETEESILVKTLAAINLPRLVEADEELFKALLDDFFDPKIGAGAAANALRAKQQGAASSGRRNSAASLAAPSSSSLTEGLTVEDEGVDEAAALSSLLQTHIRHVAERKKLVATPAWLSTVMQLHDTQSTRHGTMVIGNARVGKTVTLEALRDALSALAQQRQFAHSSNHGKPSVRRRNSHGRRSNAHSKSVGRHGAGGGRVLQRRYVQCRMFPKAISTAEMFGETDRSSGEWIEGVFAALWGKYNQRGRRDVAWICCDGPIDSQWIENLNTVLDDSRILTLANGDRIPMTDNVKLFFESEDLNHASPATVSRCGVVYISESTTSWRTVVDGWCSARQSREESQVLRELFNRYLGHSVPEVPAPGTRPEQSRTRIGVSSSLGGRKGTPSKNSRRQTKPQPRSQQVVDETRAKSKAERLAAAIAQAEAAGVAHDEAERQAEALVAAEDEADAAAALAAEKSPADLAAAEDRRLAEVLTSYTEGYKGSTDTEKCWLIDYVLGTCQLALPEGMGTKHIVENVLRLLTSLLAQVDWGSGSVVAPGANGDTGASANGTADGDGNGKADATSTATSSTATADGRPFLAHELERIFVFALMSVVRCVVVDDRECARVDSAIRTFMTCDLPTAAGGSLLGSYVDVENSTEWAAYPSFASPQPAIDPTVCFTSVAGDLLVPTSSEFRISGLTRLLQASRFPVLLVGGMGSGKSSVAALYLEKFCKGLLEDNARRESVFHSSLSVNFTAATTTTTLQKTIEAELDKRGGKNFGPPAGHVLTVFIDDLALPESNETGCKTTLELVRQVMAQKQLCFLEKERRGDFKNLQDINFVAALRTRGAFDRGSVSQRLVRLFFPIQVADPDADHFRQIYEPLLRHRFSIENFDVLPGGASATASASGGTKSGGPVSDALKHLGATLKVISWVRKSFLPTPQRPHYVFSFRDACAIMTSLLRVPTAALLSNSTGGGAAANGNPVPAGGGSIKKALVMAWRHECLRCISDQLTSGDDQRRLNNELDFQCKAILSAKSGGGGGGKGPKVAQLLADPMLKPRTPGSPRRQRSGTESGGGDKASPYHQLYCNFGSTKLVATDEITTRLALHNFPVDTPTDMPDASSAAPGASRGTTPAGAGANAVQAIAASSRNAGSSKGLDRINLLDDAAVRVTNLEYLPLGESGKNHQLDPARKIVTAELERFNRLHRIGKMDGLVLFDYALEHLVRVSRIISAPGGCALLVGYGGSGRKSITRLAIHINRFSVFIVGGQGKQQMSSSVPSVSSTRPSTAKDSGSNSGGGTDDSFLEDLRGLFRRAGSSQGEEIVMVIRDVDKLHAADPKSLQVINDFLISGAPTLFPKEELVIMAGELRKRGTSTSTGTADAPTPIASPANASKPKISSSSSSSFAKNAGAAASATSTPALALKKQNSGLGGLEKESESAADHNRSELVGALLKQIRANLRLVFCVSPQSYFFRKQLHQYAGILNRCTLDWFLPWPAAALAAVSSERLAPLVVQPPAVANNNPEGGSGKDKKSKVSVDPGLGLSSKTAQALRDYFGWAHGHVTALTVVANRQNNGRAASVHVTPTTFLCLLDTFHELYTAKRDDIREKANRVAFGVDKLIVAGQDIEKMKDELVLEEMKLKEAEDASSRMLVDLQESSLKAKKESDVVERIRENCVLEKDRIAKEEREAAVELEAAMPFLRAAEEAIDSISPKDIHELKNFNNPADIIKLIFDCVMLLKMEQMVPVSAAAVTLGIGKARRKIPFIKNSYVNARSNLLGKTNFLQTLIQFGETEKDLINEETIEFMQPYLDLPNFEPKVAKNAAAAAQGMCVWVQAMVDYHEASKVVKPKLETLHEAQGRLLHATEQLRKAEERVKACREIMAEQTLQFEKQVQEKAKIEANALATRERMDKATTLLTDLADEKKRWTSDKDRFKVLQTYLAGDCAYAATFLTYCGAFNKGTRESMINAFLHQLDGGGPTDSAGPGPSGGGGALSFASATPDVTSQRIIRNPDLALNDFLVDRGQQEDWVLNSLPLDTRSVENALLITASPRFPLLIDPQGQALKWLTSQEASRLPVYGTMHRSHPKLREQLQFAVGQGRAVIVTGVNDSNLDDHLMAIMRRNVVVHGTLQRIEVGDSFWSYDPSFSVYLVTRSAAANFSPELQSFAVMVDFGVTQQGLSEQLLGLVIQKEQGALEQQLHEALSVVASSSKVLQELDDILLTRLTTSKGNLLDDGELIRTLSSTKARHGEVEKKFQTAAATREEIRQKREEFRAVATRGSLLYAAVADMSTISPMYQVSLEKFSQLFVRAMANAPQAQITARRVYNIVDELTYVVYRFASRGLYVRHKLIFVTIMLLKMYVFEAQIITKRETDIFLHAGGLLSSSELDVLGACPVEWMTTAVWRNVVTVSRGIHELRDLEADVIKHSNAWKVWAETQLPEQTPVPTFEGELLRGDRGKFLRLVLVRAFREDRATTALRRIIKQSGQDATASLSSSSASSSSVVATDEGTGTSKPSAEVDTPDASGTDGPAPVILLDEYRTTRAILGERFLMPTTDTMADVLGDMDSNTPAVFLLSPGADPTDKILQMSRRQKQDLRIVSMGQGQLPTMTRLIREACARGGWVLLQNCHLELECTNAIEQVIQAFLEDGGVASSTGTVDVSAGDGQHGSGTGHRANNRGGGNSSATSNGAHLSSLLGGNSNGGQRNTAGASGLGGGGGKGSSSSSSGSSSSSSSSGSTGTKNGEGGDDSEASSALSSGGGTRNGGRRGRLHHGFRLFLTTEPHPGFPSSVLQRSVKVTDEPPRGIKEGMLRSFSTLVDQDKLERIEDSSWRNILFTTCFLHSVVQERGQYGSVGWNVAYEFNLSDLQCSLQFLEKHLYSNKISWATVQFMISQVFYGGKITDRQDARLFGQIVKQWVCNETLQSSFSFNPQATNVLDPVLRSFQYAPPSSDCMEIEDFRRHIEEFPEVDPPELFGLHPNASLRFMLDESRALLDSLATVQRQTSFGSNDDHSATAAAARGDGDVAAGVGATEREQLVLQTVRDVLMDLPPLLPSDLPLADGKNTSGTSGTEKRKARTSTGASAAASASSSSTSSSTANALEVRAAAEMNQPLAHFLRQELARMTEVQVQLERHLQNVVLSVTAAIQKTPQLVCSITELGQGLTPSALVEVSWQCRGFGAWLDVLRRRHAQLAAWREAGGVRPASVWLGGLFNPVGFLISVRQGVARAIRVQEDRVVALDEMALHAEVTDIYDVAEVGKGDASSRLLAGVYLHGLVLEGAAWSKSEQSLVESAPKSLTCPMPVVYITCLTKLQKRNTTGDYGAYGAYECPCYTYQVRSEETFVFNLDLSSRHHRPRHWILRGVAILCSDAI